MNKPDRDPWGTIGMPTCQGIESVQASHLYVPTVEVENLSRSIGVAMFSVGTQSQGNVLTCPIHLDVSKTNVPKISHYGRMRIPYVNTPASICTCQSSCEHNSSLAVEVSKNQQYNSSAEPQLKDYYSIRYSAQKYQRQGPMWTGLDKAGPCCDERFAMRSGRRSTRQKQGMAGLCRYYNTKYHHWEQDLYYDAQAELAASNDEDEEDDWEAIFYDAEENHLFEARAAPASYFVFKTEAEKKADREAEERRLEEKNRAQWLRIRKMFQEDMARMGLFGRAVAEAENAARCGKPAESDIEDMLGDCVESLADIFSADLQDAFSQKGTNSPTKPPSDFFDENVAELDAIEPLAVERTYWSLPYQKIDWEKIRLPVPLAQCWGWPPLPENAKSKGKSINS